MSREWLAPGRILHGAPGLTALPVDCALELFDRADVFASDRDIEAPYSLLDPCAGAAYHLTVLSLLRRNRIRSITARDVDARACEFAAKNLAISNLAGLERRAAEIEARAVEFGKESYRTALRDVPRFREAIGQAPDPVFSIARVDALSGSPEASSVEILFSDLPYGRESTWVGGSNALEHFMISASRTIVPNGILALVSGKDDRPYAPGLERIGWGKWGRRRWWIFRRVE